MYAVTRKRIEEQELSPLCVYGLFHLIDSVLRNVHLSELLREGNKEVKTHMDSTATICLEDAGVQAHLDA